MPGPSSATVSSTPSGQTSADIVMAAGGGQNLTLLSSSMRNTCCSADLSAYIVPAVQRISTCASGWRSRSSSAASCKNARAGMCSLCRWELVSSSLRASISSRSINCAMPRISDCIVLRDCSDTAGSSLPQRSSMEVCPCITAKGVRSS